jgi:hypothetical protein
MAGPDTIPNGGSPDLSQGFLSILYSYSRKLKDGEHRGATCGFGRLEIHGLDLRYR